MTKLEELNRKMLELERMGVIYEQEYATYRQLLEAVGLAGVAFEVYMANGQSEEPSEMNSMHDLEVALEALK